MAIVQPQPAVDQAKPRELASQHRLSHRSHPLPLLFLPPPQPSGSIDPCLLGAPLSPALCGDLKGSESQDGCYVSAAAPLRAYQTQLSLPWPSVWVLT